MSGGGGTGLEREIIDLELEEKKADEARAEEEKRKRLAEAQKQNFLKMHQKLASLKTGEARLNFIANQEDNNRKILKAKAECRSHKEFIEKMENFSIEEKFNYQLLIIAYNAIDKAEYGERLQRMTDEKAKSEFIQDCIKAFEGYKALPKEDQAKKSFSFTREEMKKIAFGNAAVQNRNRASHSFKIRFKIPEGYKQNSIAVPIPTSAGAPADGPREFVIVQIPSHSGTCQIQFVRKQYPVRVTIPQSWTKKQTEVGDTIGVKLRPNAPKLALNIPPGLIAGDVVLVKVAVKS